VSRSDPTTKATLAIAGIMNSRFRIRISDGVGVPRSSRCFENQVFFVGVWWILAKGTALGVSGKA
jgi:hypothetical protein